MGRRYIEEARGRMELGEAQECVELFLKGAVRLVAVEPARTHDVAELLRRESDRFPGWLKTEIAHLASISTEMAADRGIAFYGDERQGIAPSELFEAEDADRALRNLEYVGKLCLRLLESAA
jgi:HEPN domain-containing protein